MRVSSPSPSQIWCGELVLSEIHNLRQRFKKSNIIHFVQNIIKKQSASINWSEPSEVIFAKFRAFYNWPNLYSYHLGKRFIVNDLDLSDYKSEVAGKIEKINGSLYIHTSSNMLCIKIIQFEGKKPVQALAYFNNFDLSKTILETK